MYSSNLLEDTDIYLFGERKPIDEGITFESVIDDIPTEIASHEIETVWNVGTTISADCSWRLEEIPDNMGLRVTVTDLDTGEVVCSMEQPVEKETALDLGELEIVNRNKNRVDATFALSNSGNVPAYPTAVVYALGEDGKQTELSRIQLAEIAPLQNTKQVLPLEIEETYQTIADGQGAFELQIDILEGEEVSYSTTLGGSIPYNVVAMEDIQQIEGLEVEQKSLKLRAGQTEELTADLTPVSAAERNHVVYVSSDESVAYVDAEGKVTAAGNGTATITAYAVPKMELVSVLPDGTTAFGDMRGAVPDSMIKSQEIAVTVSGSSTGGGGGGGTSFYTVTFDTQGGNKIDSVRVNRNGTLTKPVAPTREGYTFDGWYTDKECTQAYDFNTKVTKNMTLYAKWI